MTDVIAGRFALLDPISRGGSGVVWRAFDRKTGRLCAAKVLRRRDAGDLLRFVREQSVRVSHPHVLTPYSWAAEDAHVLIASELVDGGSLSTLIADNGAFAEASVAAVLGQLFAALEHVHSVGLVHRDVKPANVLLPATGTGPIDVRLSDFGLAVHPGDARLTMAGTVVGTPGYLPPELLSGDVSPSPVHDLYAAGQVAAAMLAGLEPNEVGTSLLEAIRPGPLRELIADLTATDPQRRPASATLALDRLRTIPADPHPRTLEGDPVDVLTQLPALPPEAELPRPEPAPMAAALTEPLPIPAPVAAAARHERQRGRGVLLGVAGLAAAVAIGVPVAYALANNDSGGSGATSPSRTGNSKPSTHSSGSSSHSPADGVQPVAGQACNFTEENDLSPDQSLICRKQADGTTYRWEVAPPGSN